MKGIDFSDYQAGLDLTKAKSAGIEFAIYKLSVRRSSRSRHFDTFYQQAEVCGLPMGAYVFSCATTPDAAATEANLALQILGGRRLALGIFMDVETKAQLQLDKIELVNTVRAFCRTVEAAGYRSGVYGAEYNLWTRIDPADLQDSLIWVAHYERQPVVPCDIWQTGDGDSFPDYDELVDTDNAMSERMEALVRGRQRAEVQSMPRSCEIAADIVFLQRAMQLGGYWPPEQVDGIKTPAFREAFKKYAAAVLSC